MITPWSMYLSCYSHIHLIQVILYHSQWHVIQQLKCVFVTGSRPVARRRRLPRSVDSKLPVLSPVTTTTMATDEVVKEESVVMTTSPVKTVPSSPSKHTSAAAAAIGDKGTSSKQKRPQPLQLSGHNSHHSSNGIQQQVLMVDLPTSSSHCELHRFSNI